MGVKRSRLKLPPAEYKALCDEVHTRDRWRCAVPQCRRREPLHCHHILYRSHGGDDTRQNMITLCHVCHEAVHERFMVLTSRETGSFEEINADRSVKFIFLAGWRPSRKIL